MLTSSGINLGVVPEDTQYVTNTAGDIVAFVVNGDLWSYNRSANKCTKVFSFRKKGEYELDERYNYGEHDIRIVRVSESGDITFVVYGYMNRGEHEGETGIAVYNFQSENQVAEETLFVPATVSYSVLRQSLDILSYVSTNGNLYLYLNSSCIRSAWETEAVRYFRRASRRNVLWYRRIRPMWRGWRGKRQPGHRDYGDES